MNKMREVSKIGMIIIKKFISSPDNNLLNSRTIQEYAADLKHFIGWNEYQGIDNSQNILTFSIKQITIKELETYIHAMENISELKPTTINRRISTVKKLFNWALQQGLITSNPAKNIALFPIKKVLPRTINTWEEKKLLATVKANAPLRDQAIIKLMMYTGIRVGEVCDFKKCDINLGQKSGFIIVGLGEQRRIIPLNNICRSILYQYLLGSKSQIDYLFTSQKTGNKLTERAVRHIIKKYLDIAELTGLSAYSFRHNFGYRKAKNTPLHKLAHIMGHDNLNITRAYIKTIEENSL